MAAEAKAIFEQAKCALHLDGAAKTQIDPTFRHDIFRCLLPFFPECLLEHDLLGLGPIFGPAASCSVGTAAAIFTSVPGAGHKLAIMHLCYLPSQMQLPTLCTGKAVCLGVIFHVLNSAHLLAKLACLLLIKLMGFMKYIWPFCSRYG